MCVGSLPVRKFNFIPMLKKSTIGFAVIPNTILKDNRLSMKARFLWAFINDKPEGWDFSAKRIAEELGTGEKSVKTGMKELQECGYLSFEAKMDKAGRFSGQNYILTDGIEEHPQTDASNNGAPQIGGVSIGGGQNQTEKNQTERFKEKKEKNEELDSYPDFLIRKEYTDKDSPVPGYMEWDESPPMTKKHMVDKVFELMAELNPAWDDLKTQKHQRECAKKALKKLQTLDRLRGVIAGVHRTRGEQYAPHITTPEELYYKLGKLMAFMDKERTKQEPDIPTFGRKE